MTTAYPLAWPQGWPRARSRKRAKFSTRGYATDSAYRPSQELSISGATKRVLGELERFGVLDGDSIISTNLVLRLDGLPRSDQKAPADPGVAVYWRRRPGEGQKVMAIDIYDRVADNIAAIAATLDAMRAIERHGGAQILERAFTGFAALPPPESPWARLGVKPGASADAINEAYRIKAAKTHPDVGGDADAMAALNAARTEALRLTHDATTPA